MAQHAGAATPGVLLPSLLSTLGMNVKEGRQGLGLRMSGFTSRRDFSKDFLPTCLPAGWWFWAQPSLARLPSAPA